MLIWLLYDGLWRGLGCRIVLNLILLMLCINIYYTKNKKFYNNVLTNTVRYAKLTQRELGKSNQG